ncbi:MAG: hypothetical protein ABIA63_08800 [bacterium]
MSNHNFKFGLSNKANSNSSLFKRNRMIFYANDSVVFGNINFNFRFRVDQKGREADDTGWDDPDLEWAYDMDRMVMDWKVNKILSLKLGKDRLNWGPLKIGGLLLADYNQGFNMVHQEYKLGPFVLKGLCAQLNSLYNGEINYTGDSAEVLNRFYSASRLEYCQERYGLAVAQSIIYSGINRSFEIQYVLPFYPYYYSQMSNWRYGNSNENIFVGMDYYFWLKKYLKMYGELLIDDFQIHSDAESQSVQNSIAYMLGIEFSCNDKYSGFIEGGQINSFVYNHGIGKRLQYRIENAFIGSPLGPDQRLVWGNFTRKMKLLWDIGLDFWVRRSGERNINYTYVSVFNTRDDSVPYGSVENENAIWLKNNISKFNVSISLEGGWVWYNNMDNKKGNSRNFPFIALSVCGGLKLSADGS